ncbi:MAG: hypothetical protein CL840_07400 [Crocinitomicaceae bacterium]|nr:hypothetical protein [Crocinitomicaceae bacterium]|tara:strand:- start:11266 stop:12030 length:765 start_codon:yes stop_codon:yes gene_type:complete
MRLILLSILSICFINRSWSNGDQFYNQLVEAGNKAYDESKYDSAITFYSQVVNADFQSATLFYNLGNAYFKDMQLAPAIYYYEKALKLSPSDADIKFNLEMANSQITDKMPKKPVPILDRGFIMVSSLLTPNSWGVLTVVLLVLAIGLFASYLLSSSVSIKRLSFFGSLGLTCICFTSGIIGQMVKSNLITKDQAIVFVSTLTVKSEPRLNSADLFVIHEGTKVAVLEDGEKWLRIALPDGNEGWARADDVKTF